MKKNLTLTLVLAAALFPTACTPYLDMTPSDRVSEKTIWAETRSAEYAINYLYTYIWDVNAAPTSLGLTEALTDELKYTSYNYNALCYLPSEMAYGGSVLTDTYVDAYLGYWGTLYTAIRRINADLSYLKAYGTMEEAEHARLEGELRFLRAYMYFELTKRYKDVILYREDLGEITKDKAVSREAGARSKIAVWSKDENVDPIGACIGPRRTRLENVMDELNGEKIDIIRYSEDPAQFISAALSPAQVEDVEILSLQPKSCRVTVPDEQLSLAIGNRGQNARLAARLTGFNIDIHPASGYFDFSKGEE